MRDKFTWPVVAVICSIIIASGIYLGLRGSRRQRTTQVDWGQTDPIVTELASALKSPTFEEIGRDVSPQGKVADEIRAKLFRLVDDAGKTKAFLGTQENGDPILCLSDGDNLRIVLDVTEDVSAVHLFDKDPISGDQPMLERVLISVSDEPSMFFTNQQHEKIIQLGSLKHVPFVLLGDPNDARVFLRVEDESGKISISDKDDREGFRAFVADEMNTVIIGDDKADIILSKDGDDDPLVHIHKGKNVNTWSLP